ncbi:MAG TPA: ABC transporter permease [Blastocatellia bacterium]|nr:ABC transporter permease [Blastocatellia bacterium]
MQTLLADLRYAVRIALKNPGFTLVAVTALALGVGAATAIFSVVNAVLLRPLPYGDPDRIVLVTETGASGDERWAAPADFIDWAEQNQVFESIGAMRWWSANLTGAGEPERVQGALISVGLFDVFGVRPALGRTFIEDEGREGRDSVVLLSHALWQRRFGGDPDIVGKSVSLNGASLTVIGVMPADFKLPLLAINQSPSQTELWTPIASSSRYWQARGAHQLRVLARLRPGVSLSQARAEMSAIAARIEQLHPQTNTRVGALVTPFHEKLAGDMRPALTALLCAVVFLILIACANVANLLLARSAPRQKEIAIRTALGATRMRLIRQMLTESALLSIAGGGLGLLLALWGTDTLIALGPENVPRLQETSIDGNVLLFALGLSLLTGLVFGIVPALQTSKTDLNTSLKDSGRSSSGGVRHSRLRAALVAAEVALSLMLLVGAGLMVKSFLRLQQVEPGFETANVLTMAVSLPFSKYAERDQQAAFYREAIRLLAALPGVEAASAGTTPPLTGSRDSLNFFIEGRGDEKAIEELAVIAPDYFRATGIPLLRGRDFSGTDNARSEPVVIISRSMAERYWPGEDAIGKRIKLGGDEGPWRSIIGIVGDVKQKAMEAESAREIYLPYNQDPWFLSSTMTFVIRSAVEPESLVAAARGEIQSIDKDLPIYSVRTMEEIYSLAVAGRRFNTLLLTVFAVAALVLAAMGIYGVVSYSVEQRTHEIGIRMAMGARAADISRMVVVQGMIPIAAGLVIGISVSYALSRLMEGLLFGVSATDLSTFAAIPLLLVAVAVAACYFPARRATRIDPMAALRCE